MRGAEAFPFQNSNVAQFAKSYHLRGVESVLAQVVDAYLAGNGYVAASNEFKFLCWRERPGPLRPFYVCQPAIKASACELKMR